VAQLRSYELHIKLDYRLRSWGLALATLTILIGAVMVFAGLQGSFDWAVEAPHTISARLTNASPGIVFATIGMILSFVVVMQRMNLLAVVPAPGATSYVESAVECAHCKRIWEPSLPGPVIAGPFPK
jgi:hypothetical protein